MKTTYFILLSLLAPLSSAFAVTPPPGGDYPGENTALGDDALFSLTTGTDNTALGFNALYGDTTGYSNTALGSLALQAMTDGAYNTASGYLALSSVTTGDQNTATGAYSLVANTAGGNTAYGAFSLTANTTGSASTALGVGALYGNTTGYSNTATGLGALENNTTGYSNTAEGVNCMFYNTTGYADTAVGDQALYSNGTGSYNTVIGFDAMLINEKGSSNIAIGYSAGSNCTGSDNIMIGNVGSKHDGGAIRIGFTQTKTFIAGINGTTVPMGVAVVVDPNGQLGTVTSSARYKEAIKPMDKASEAVLSLEPVTFRYKKALDPEAIPQFGLIAEQVAKVDPDLVARDEEGKPYTVRYEAVNAMLLNEFLKEHRKVEAQGADMKSQQKMIKELQSTVVALQSALASQAAQLEKVNERLAASQPSLRVVENR